MAGKQPEYDDDAPELTDAELAEMRPAREVLSPEEFAAVSSVRRGRPPADDPKISVTIRLDRAVVEAYRATGPGWQTRMNEWLLEGAIQLGGSPEATRPKYKSGSTSTRFKAEKYGAPKNSTKTMKKDLSGRIKSGDLGKRGKKHAVVKREA